MATAGECEREIPIVRDVEVVVAGGGCAGVFAGLSAAKRGARTLLIERFGTLGGNSGPGMIYGCVNPFAGASHHLSDGEKSLAAEMHRRVEARRPPSVRVRPAFAALFSDVAMQMAEEYGLDLMLSAYAADPMVEEGVCKGLFVETKSGRVAVRARVVIDATAEADLARRAGAPYVRRVPADVDFLPAIREHFNRAPYQNWNEIGHVFMVTGIDWKAYERFIGDGKAVRLQDVRPIAPPGIIHDGNPQYPAQLLPAMREEWKAGTYRFARELRPGTSLFWETNMNSPEYGFVRVGYDSGEGTTTIHGDLDIDDWEQISLAERVLRRHAHETLEFMRRRAAGWADAWMLFTAPFMGARGGPFIEGEYMVTPDDIVTGARHEDVVIRATWETRYREVLESPKATPRTADGYDIPYRMMLPKGLDNILVVGRGSSYVRRGHDPGTRGRVVQYRLGEIAGIAATMAVAAGQTAKSLNVKELQRRLLAEGFTFGDTDRLRELGLLDEG